MPATDEYWRSLPRMHQWFAGSAIVLLAATLLMMYKDEDRSWRGIQIQGEDLKVAKLEGQLEQVDTPEVQQEIAAAKAALKAAEDSWKVRDDAVREEQAKLAEKDGQVQILSRISKNYNAERDKARADYDLKVRDQALASELTEALVNYQQKAERAAEKAAELELEKVNFDSIKESVDEARKQLDLAQADLAAAAAAVKPVTDQISSLSPANQSLPLAERSRFKEIKRAIKEWPIINGFNPHLKIQYDWARDLEIGMGMARVDRVDRCRTCHVNVTEFGAGNVANYPADKYQQPFATHPNPAVFLAETSPHPVSRFACTICHEGDGSGTAFLSGEHTAPNPAVGALWHQEYGWHKNHFWEYPMFPKQFTEASCLRCHHNVVELGTNAKFGNTAPTVVKGYNLIRDYGCFGCHEINGYDGAKPIGPDLRLEPQTADEAEKYASDPNQIAGQMMKVGPSLRHIAKKTTPEFIAYWVTDPQRFRPTTRMPKPFGLSNQQDATAHALEPVEQAAVAAFLMSKSQPLELLKPVDGYVPDVARGLELFKTRGCLTCHSRQGEAFAGVAADFGPDLSRIHEKVKPGPEGFLWLYTWIKEPTKYHQRTKMPDLFLDPVTDKGVTIDPAADIAAYLLQGGATEFPPLPVAKAYLGFAIPAADSHGQHGHEPAPAPADRGVTVAELVQASPAERAQRRVGDQLVDHPILEGDVILAIGGQAVNSPEKLMELDGAGNVGETVAVTISRRGQEIELQLIRSTPEDDLLRLFLGKALGSTRLQTALDTRRYPVTAEMFADGKSPADYIKGDEVELAARSLDEVVTPEEWARRKTIYLGRKTISRYGCYGCHDIPGFEAARPIGTALQDWGRKDTSKLAYEHIHEFLHHHGEADGSSTADKMDRAVREDFGNPGKNAESVMVDAYLYQDVISHGRAGFLWQKLREPRSYDYKKTETKGWDERLRMPKFAFDSDDLHAVATFVLGLVSDPPAPSFQYRPTGVAGAIVQGERLLAKYNCTGCHMVEMPVWEFGIAEDNLTVPDMPEADRNVYEKFKYIKPPQHGWTGTQGKGGLPILRASGYPQQFPDPLDEPDLQQYSFVAWDPIDLGEGKLLMPGQPIAVSVSNLLKKGEGRGGTFAQWLIPQLPNKTPGVKDINEAWQAAPPPLVGEGRKVQTAWLYQFLKNPEQLRYTTVLRMPKFNLSDEEAQILANYFAASQHAPYPYQAIPQRQQDVQREQQTEYAAQYPDARHPDYLEASWLVLNGPLCRKCHNVGGNVITDYDPAQVKRGPNLQRVEKRLQSDFAQLWIYNPKWVLPYTSMPQNFPPGSASAMVELFKGENSRQAEAVVDALFNYTTLAETHGKTTYDPPGAAAAAPGGAGAPAGDGN